MTAEEIKQYGREWMLERAAILEYEGGWSRKDAEALAVAEWHKLCAHDPALQVERAA
jgi:hypothetical protein